MSGAVLVDVEVCTAIASPVKANNEGAVFGSRVSEASRRDVMTTRNGRVAKVKFEGLHVDVYNLIQTQLTFAANAKVPKELTHGDLPASVRIRRCKEKRRASLVATSYRWEYSV